jgi:hypothetical protein
MANTTREPADAVIQKSLIRIQQAMKGLDATGAKWLVRRAVNEDLVDIAKQIEAKNVPAAK